MAVLTEKQKRFIDFYIELGNATQAAIKAGYSEKHANKSGSACLSRPSVKAELDERLKQLEDERVAKANEVMKYLTSVMRGEKEEEIVVVEGDGDGMSSARKMKKLVGAKEQIKAAELIGKRYGIFTDKLSIENAIPVVIVGGDELEE